MVTSLFLSFTLAAQAYAADMTMGAGGNVIWSINIMIAILLIAVGISIYYIMMYDTWYPNEQISEDSGIGITGREITGEAEGAH